MMFRTAFPTDFPCSPRPFQVKSAPHLQLKVINTLRPGPRGFWGGLRHRMVLLLALLLTAATSAFTQTTNVRINCGGPAYTDAAGHNWLADTYFVGGTKYSFGTKSVAGTNDPALYQTERYAANLVYNIPVTNGSYTVTLLFAEMYFTAAGQRVFSVALEGQTV